MSGEITGTLEVDYRHTAHGGGATDTTATQRVGGDSYIFDVLKDIPDVDKKIKNRSGSRLLQAYLYGLSCELDMSVEDLLDLSVDPLNPEKVDVEYFEEAVYGNGSRLRSYEWELKQFLKKAGCDRDLLYNHFKSITEGEDLTRKSRCGSVLCPECNNELILKRKESLARYVMDVPHTQFTFTVDRERWDRLNWKNMGDLYKSVEVAVKKAFKERYNVEVGAVANLHPFGSNTLEWQPHIDVFVSLMGFDENGDLWGANKWFTDPDRVKYVDPVLLELLRGSFTGEVLDRIGGPEPNTKSRFFRVHQNTDKHGEVIRKPLVDIVDGDKVGGGILGDSMRYYKRLTVSDEHILDVDRERVVFTTDKRVKEGMEPLELPPRGFYGRVSQHIAPRNFRSMRSFGVYAPNHRFHDLAKKEHGYNLGGIGVDLRRGGLREIARVVYDIILEMGGDIDPDIPPTDVYGEVNDAYRSRLGYVVANAELRLNRMGVYKGGQNRLVRVVRSLIDFACQHETYKEGPDKPVLDVRELRNLMTYEGKDLSDSEYVIYDKVIKKVYSGLQDPITTPNGDLCIYSGYYHFNRYVNKSYIAMSIFNTYDFKKEYSGLYSLLRSTNNYFERLKRKKGPPDDLGDVEILIDLKKEEDKL